MRYLFVFIFITIIIASIHAQNKRDYVWILGGDHEQAPGPDMYTFDFNQRPFEPFATDNTYDVEGNASICDEEGNLLFYTNGCAVLNAEREVMPNGDSINYGAHFEWYNESNCRYGYGGFQDFLILTDPVNANGYYLVHKRPSLVSGEPTFNKEILYTYIDMTLDEGKGDVVDKNVLFYDNNDFRLLNSYLTAIQHSNGKDWWVLQPQKDSNIYLTFLLDESGIHRMEDQSIGKVFHWNASSSGTAKFSPDGTMYAFYNEEDGILLFDFDRSTGQLSNYRRIVPDATTGTGVFCSVEWSPNSRFIYTASKYELYQVDLWEENPEDDIVLIDTYDGTQNPFSNTFFLMAQGPDCRIYMCSTSGNETYHVINNPDEKGLACNFHQNGLTLPNPAGFGSMPNHVRWRVDEEEKCDPDIVSVFGMPVYTNIGLKVYPNPTSDYITIDIPDAQSGKISIRNSIGLTVKEVEVASSVIKTEVGLYNLPTGVYFVEFVPDKNSERVIYAGKVELVR